jgi:hypothetical protein
MAIAPERGFTSRSNVCNPKRMQLTIAAVLSQEWLRH